MHDLYQAERDSLRSLALAAAAYAHEVHHTHLNTLDLTTLDQVLEREASTNQSSIDMAHSPNASVAWLSSCFGAWIGQAAVERFDAHWIDLAERHAPRLMVAGIPVSPMDAIERLLLRSADALQPSEIFRRFEQWSVREQRLNQTARAQNQHAWDQLADHPRFVDLVQMDEPLERVPESTTQAIESLDPWLREVWRPNLKVLCLAAGGGRHGPILARAGAQVTIVDISERQLSLDREWSDAYGVSLRCLQTSIDDLSLLRGETFDVVIQPVSSCYVADMSAVYQQVALFTKQGAIYLSQHKLAPSMLVTQAANQQLRFASEVYGEGPLEPSAQDQPHPNREPQMIEYAHGLATLLGGLCRAGFAITDVQEPCLADALAPVGSEAWQACFVRPFIKIKSIRT